ncbi:MAG: D-Ala-D-Ala carboxypeptidase family metallohydrolase [Microcoleaceae cyanobacterium]
MTIQIIKPISEKEFELGTKVKFEGTADSPITEVELWADDRWFLGKVAVSGGKWSFSYSFNVAGYRIIYAKGLDQTNALVDTHDIWVIIESPSDIDLDLKLTLNFTLGEMIFSQTAINRGIDNTPTKLEIDRLRRLCEQILQPARDVLGPLRINSGFRSEKLNEVIRGAPNSAHRLGYAADVIPTSGDTRALAKWVVDNRPFDQVILEYGTLAKPGWIHISADPRNRKQVLRIDNLGTKFISI